MRKEIIEIIAVVVALAILAPRILAQDAGGEDKRREQLGELVIQADRPLRESGLMRTRFDSVALRENIALSMADVLAYNSSVFVKNHGRASLSTVAFRGTSPSHTLVTWNSLPVASPMLGMADFSTLPSYFIDKADLLHGASSVVEQGGGLGGMVRLSTSPEKSRGLKWQFVQGVGSFSTFDEFARISYAARKWQLSSRVSFSKSKNDFKYTNHDKILNIYDSDHNIIGRYHPRERNRNGAFQDFHFMQEGYWRPSPMHLVSLKGWYSALNRALPLLSVDYSESGRYENRQREETLRAVGEWKMRGNGFNTLVDAGYVHIWSAYDYMRSQNEDMMLVMTRSRSRVNMFNLSGSAEWTPTRKWDLELSVKALQNLVESRDRNRIDTGGALDAIGYRVAQFDMTAAISARYTPISPLGIALTLREESHGRQWAPLIPALMMDAMVWQKIDLRLRASVTRNYKYPTINDRYFLPGGNPDLQPERGWSYDAGVSARGNIGNILLEGAAGWFDSRIDDWIIWLPTVKGFFSPRNVKSVHAYGVECKLKGSWPLGRGWLLQGDANYSYTPSVNVGEPLNDADRSVGRQLPYVPRNSASAIGTLSWKGWGLQYKWCWYSRRYTMSSNDNTLSGRLPHYFMSNIALEKDIPLQRLMFNFRLAVNNLFNEDYLSVLSRPMPGINAEFFISLSWK